MRPDEALRAVRPRSAIASGAAVASPLGSAGRILVMRLDNLGDVVMTGPLFRTLRAARPDAELVLLASPGGAAAAALLPWVDRVLTARTSWQDAAQRLPQDPARELELVAELRELRADAAIVATSFSQTPWVAAYVAYLAGIPVRAGHADGFGGSVLSHAVPGPAPVHQVERNLHLAAGLGLEVRDTRLEVRVPAPAGARVAALLADGGVREAPILVLPGASASARRYDPARFAEAAADLAARTALPVVVAGTERESAMVSRVAAGVRRALPLAGRLDVPELAALIARSAVVLANDSLGMHLADALDVPVVVPFAGTDREAEWGPRDALAALLREPTACAPCRLFDCPIGQPCLDIDPARVASAAAGLLSRRPLAAEVPCAG